MGYYETTLLYQINDLMIRNYSFPNGTPCLFLFLKSIRMNTQFEFLKATIFKNRCLFLFSLLLLLIVLEKIVPIDEVQKQKSKSDYLFRNN